MDEKIKEFLESKRAENENLAAQERKNTLISLGLFRNEEAQYVNGVLVSKQIPCDVTDEEYKEILKYYRQVKFEKKSNVVGYILVFISAFIIVIGIIVAVLLEDWIVALSSVLSSLLLMAFGQISITLTDIFNCINKM